MRKELIMKNKETEMRDAVDILMEISVVAERLAKNLVMFKQKRQTQISFPQKTTQPPKTKMYKVSTPKQPPGAFRFGFCCTRPFV